MPIQISQPTNLVLKYARLQRNFLWDVLLPDISAKTFGVPTFGLVGLAIGQFVQEIRFGDYSFEDNTTMKYGPYQASFPGVLRVNDITMKFIKTMPDIISPYFNAWKDLIIDKNGLYKPKANYQKTIYVRFLDSAGIAVGRYKLMGCFPTTFPSYQLNYTDNDVLKVEVTFKVDNIEYEVF